MTIEIRSTLREVPIRAIVYGADGVGKSTLCAAAPRAVFIATEDGLDNIDARAVDPPESWPAIIEAVDALAADDRCGTIVIDSLDWSEQMLWAHLVATKPNEKGHKVKDIEGYGYGKGYIAAATEWRVLIAALQRAGKAGKHVLLTAHAQRKSVKNPTGEDFEQIQIKLQERAAGLFREWVHVVAFAELDIATVTDKDDGGRTKGVFTGKRILRTQPGAGYQSKSRLTLPEKIPLDWVAFEAAVKAGRPISVDDLAAQLVALVGDNASLTDRCAKFLESRGKTAAAYHDAIANVQRVIDETKAKEAAE
jgi:predicted ATPase